MILMTWADSEPHLAHMQVWTCEVTGFISVDIVYTRE